VALLLPLVALEFGLFFLAYRDEFFLLRIVKGPIELPTADHDRLRAIYEHSIFHERRPSDDRLVLLESALLHVRDLAQVAEVTKVLAKRDRDNLGLQLAYAQALDDTGESAAALREYPTLVRRIRRGDFPAEERGGVLLANARTAVHAEQYEAAISLYRTVLDETDLGTDDVVNELAGVLLRAGKFDEVMGLYESYPPDEDGKVLLVKARMDLHDYAAAEKDCRELLARRPTELPVQLLLLHTISMEKKFEEARALLDELLQEYPDSVPIRVQAGQTSLAVAPRSPQFTAGFYVRALRLFEGLLVDRASLGEYTEPVLRGFIDAASAVQDPKAIDLTIAAQVMQRLDQTSLAKESAYLERLAWVFQRRKEYEPAAALLRRMLDLDPQSADLRKRYVGCLLDGNRAGDAAAYLQGLPVSSEVRRMLVGVYMHQKDYTAAERICRTALRSNPYDNFMQIMLAEVLLARKDPAAPAAVAEVQEIINPDPKVQARVADVLLWAGNTATALDRYRALLAKDFQQASLWPGYVNAAAAAPTLNRADHALLERLAGQPLAEQDVLYLSRLAWNLHRAKLPEPCDKVLDAAVAQKSTDPAAQRELAGVLGAAGRFKGAIELLQGLPLSPEVRLRIAGMYEGEEDFPRAAAQYRALLKDHPNDVKVQQQLGQVLIWSKDYVGAIPYLEQLVHAEPDKVALRQQLAEVKQLAGDSAGALALYTQLLDANFEQPQLWTRFVDTAASLANLDQGPIQVAHRLSAVWTKKPPTEPVYLSRLAWVLVRAGDSARSAALLKQALAMNLPEPEVRKEIAGVLGAVGMFRQAIDMLEGLQLTQADRIKLVELYNGARDFIAAENECRRLRRESPDNRELALLMADVLSYRGKFTEAAALIRELQQVDADSPLLARRQARFALWGRNYARALADYSELLQKNEQDAELQAGFVAAAAAAPALDAQYRRPLLELAAKAGASRDPIYLSRLAQALRQLKEYSSAVDLLQRAVDLDTASGALRLQLAETFYDAGRLDDAERSFRGVLGR
jgi:tetratricopeptide (TPR) repeat protein